MKLPIPFTAEGMVLTDAKIERPRAGVIADTAEAVQSHDSYTGLHVFVSGCISELSGPGKLIDDKLKIKSAVRNMPYRSLEVCTIDALLKNDTDDGIEGIYPCPRCGTNYIAEKTPDSDTLDYVSQMTVRHRENEGVITHILSEPVIIKMKGMDGESYETINSLEFRYVTLADCMAATRALGMNSSKIQMRMYAEAIVKANGLAASPQWVAQWGQYILENVPTSDIRAINDKQREYGINFEVDRTCRKCGKIWKAEVNSSNFFASGLR